MKRVISAIVGFVLTLSLPAMALADHIDGNAGWFVEYNSAGRLEDNYTQRSWADNISKLQPGDDITLTVEIRQSNDTPADWYMSNAVLKSLEDGDAKGSAYGYTLSYEGPNNSRTLYSSKSVGGEGSAAGLADATNAMDDYFYLGTLAKGETGKVVLNVALDGETEGNAYFDTLARLSLKFAVEPNVNPENKTVTENQTVTDQKTVIEDQNVTTGGGVNRTISGSRQSLSKTGDQTSMFPVFLAIAGVGIVCLALAIRNMRNKKSDNNEKEGDER